MIEEVSIGYILGQIIAIALSLAFLGLILWLGALVWFKFFNLVTGRNREGRLSSKKTQKKVD